MNCASDEIQKRLEIAGLEIAEYLEQVESKILRGTNKNDTHHHEDNPTHKAMFRKDYTTVIGRLLPVNPFLKDSRIKVETDIIYSEEVCAFIDALVEIGQKQYKEFVDTWLIRCKKTSTLKESDLNKLRVAALFRPSLCVKVFKIETTGQPECCTKKQQMYHGNKSHLLKIFDPTHLLHQLLRKIY